MAIVALEGHEVRILHVDSRRRCVGVTRYFKLYFNTDFKFERMKVTVSIIETFVIQLWSLLLMLTIFERSLIKKLNLIPLNLLGASFDACYRLYCQTYRAIIVWALPVVSAIRKVIVSLAAQRFDFLHPGDSHVLLNVLFSSSAIVFRVMQAGLSKLNFLLPSAQRMVQ